MFRLNRRHLEIPLSSDLDKLSAKALTRLGESWAGVFYRQYFCRLDETPFAVLYTDTPSRPNVPVNVLVGLESLKAGFGWSDEEMYDHFLYDIQVRYALGYRNLGEGDFDLRTVYNFRHRLSAHMQKTGENLIDRAFVNITDQQIQAFGLQTDRLRMDTTQIASNIQRMSRLQLLVEVLQRVHRMLTEADQARYADLFAPYLKGSSGQYIYHLRGEETGPHLQGIGELMHRLLGELAPAYAQEPVYQMLQRVFKEQFTLSQPGPATKADKETEGAPTVGQQASSGTALASVAPSDTAVATPLAGEASQPGDAGGSNQATATPTAPVQVRPGKEISPHSLRSPDDPESTYRRKGEQAYEGYVANVTETCNPANPFQLIAKVQTAPNTTEDTTLLLEALPELKARTGVETLYNDATFCSPEVDALLRQLRVAQVPTALRGKPPGPERITLADYHFVFDAAGRLVQMTCPQGRTANVGPGRNPGRYIARWQDSAADPAKRETALRFSQADLDRALRRQRSQAYHADKQSLRAAIEATIGAIKHPFNEDQLPVRGKFRVGLMLLGSAVMVNIRRIQRYLLKKSEQKVPESAERGSNQSVISLLSVFWTRFLRWLWPGQPLRPVSSF